MTRHAGDQLRAETVHELFIAGLLMDGYVGGWRSGHGNWAGEGLLEDVACERSSCLADLVLRDEYDGQANASYLESMKQPLLMLGKTNDARIEAWWAPALYLDRAGSEHVCGVDAC